MRASIKPHARQRREKLDFIVPGFSNFNPSDDPAAIGDTVLTNGLNWNYDSAGAAQTAKGYSRLNTTNLPTGTDNGWTLETPVLRQLIVATTAGYLYRYDNAGGWVQIGGPFTAGARWDGQESRNKLYLVNGYDGVLVWDGTTLVVQAITGYTNIKPQYIHNRKNRLYFSERNSSIVWFTDLLDASVVQSNSFIQVNTDDGQYIMALGSNADNLTVFKDGSLWNVIGEPLTSGNVTYVGNLQIRKSNSDVGCVSYKTVQTVNKGVQVFVSTSGIFAPPLS